MRNMGSGVLSSQDDHTSLLLIAVSPLRSFIESFTHTRQNIVIKSFLILLLKLFPRIKEFFQLVLNLPPKSYVMQSSKFDGTNYED